ncbi:AraC family transcriptional regulator [Aquimarina sp. ERC-38]|uniref:helix-turn-helix domain-containing protein n=1 Tax=Aquimarina sp. ERC-38 TaxID=2949996 RepID=UPI002246625C|nr:AraC family transcriptional regulator [Aquimarina sp. ERC-38]UZO82335.1 AraC family transcriptional regulator [Aquimarina sp. ERC-38]
MEVNFNSLKNKIGGTVKEIEDGKVFYLNPAIGKGFIAYHYLQPGLVAFNIQISLDISTTLPLQFIKEDSLQFLFCQEGSILYTVAGETLSPVQIDQYQTAVLQRKSENPGEITVAADQSVVIRVIVVDRSEYFKSFYKTSELIDQNVQDILKHITDKSTYTQVGNFDLSIGEQYKQIAKTHEENEVSGSLSQKGRYYIILAKHIQKFSNEMKDSGNESGLNQSELKRVIDLSNHIKEQPEASHNIRILCQSTGLSPAKIQEGFKYLFDNTVSNYVCEIRLEKAEELIRYSDLTVSEIVYTVGLTSRSYFCKIFKKKYNYSPKDYRNRIKQQLSNTAE